MDGREVPRGGGLRDLGWVGGQAVRDLRAKERESAVDAVREIARGDAEEQEGSELQRRLDPDGRAATGEQKDEPDFRGLLEPVADLRDGLADEIRPEVAVTQRGDGAGLRPALRARARERKTHSGPMSCGSCGSASGS